MAANSNNSEQQFEPDWLSAYLDDELDIRKRQALESMLQENEDLRLTLDQLVKTRSLLRSYAETHRSQGRGVPSSASPRRSPEQEMDLNRNLNRTLQNEASQESWLSTLEDGLEFSSVAAAPGMDRLSIPASSDPKSIGLPVRRFFVAAASILGLVTISLSWLMLNRDRSNPPLAQGETSSTLSEASDEIAVLSTVPEPSAEPSAASQVAPSLDPPNLSSLLQTGMDRARRSGIGGSSSEFPDSFGSMERTDSANSTDLAKSTDLANSLGSAENREALGGLRELRDSAAPGGSRSMAGTAARSKLPEATAAPKAKSGGIASTFSAESTPDASPVESTLPRSSQNIQWHRTAEWTESEMVLFRDAHPLLETLNQIPAAQDGVKAETESQTEVDDILQAVAKTLPVAVIRIPPDESRAALQILQSWQLTPELAEAQVSSMAREESLRVLFVAPEQVREFQSWWEGIPGNKISWLAPSMAGLNSEKAILVLHFAAD